MYLRCKCFDDLIFPETCSFCLLYNTVGMMMPSVSDVHQDIDSIKSLLSALQLLLEVRLSQLENRLQRLDI